MVYTCKFFVVLSPEVVDEADAVIENLLKVRYGVYMQFFLVSCPEVMPRLMLSLKTF